MLKGPSSERRVGVPQSLALQIMQGVQSRGAFAGKMNGVWRCPTGQEFT
jgi:hypothetical protein